MLCAVGGCGQDAAKAEGGEGRAEVCATCRWQAMKLESLTDLIINEHCLFVAELFSLNTCGICSFWLVCTE